METLTTIWAEGASRLLRLVASLRGGAPPQTPGVDDESGQGLAEYALILSLIAVVAIGALALFGVNLQAVFLDPIAADVSDVLSGISP
jgi:Flp pilus assembly pilin Flp